MRDQFASLVRPIKELKCFARVELEPGQSAKVTMTVPTDMLNFTGKEGVRLVEPGQFDLMIGASSGDIRLITVVTINGEVRHLPKDWRMESHTVIV